jgi:multidrug efflux pump subunit AcrB
MKKLIALFVNRGIYADLLTIGIIIIGLMSAKKLHRDLFPNIEFDIITVSTVYPGASAKEVEKLITS